MEKCDWVYTSLHNYNEIICVGSVTVLKPLHVEDDGRIQHINITNIKHLIHFVIHDNSRDHFIVLTNPIMLPSFDKSRFAFMIKHKNHITQRAHKNMTLKRYKTVPQLGQSSMISVNDSVPIRFVG